MDKEVTQVALGRHRTRPLGVLNAEPQNPREAPPPVASGATFSVHHSWLGSLPACAALQSLQGWFYV